LAAWACGRDLRAARTGLRPGSALGPSRSAFGSNPPPARPGFGRRPEPACGPHLPSARSRLAFGSSRPRPLRLGPDRPWASTGMRPAAAFGPVQIGLRSSPAPARLLLRPDWPFGPDRRAVRTDQRRGPTSGADRPAAGTCLRPSPGRPAARTCLWPGPTCGPDLPSGPVRIGVRSQPDRPGPAFGPDPDPLDRIGPWLRSDFDWDRPAHPDDLRSRPASDSDSPPTGPAPTATNSGTDTAGDGSLRNRPAGAGVRAAGRAKTIVSMAHGRSRPRQRRADHATPPVA
jgi:hypothetical protein